MKKLFPILFSLIGWFAVIAQYILILNVTSNSLLEATTRFFSYFTILTNILVASFFTYKGFFRENPEHFFSKPGISASITVYITIVGLVYQVILRHIWEPAGLQMFVDELLHSVIPVETIIFWIVYENKSGINWKQTPKWLIYPLVYLIYVLIRGNFSGFYPYPFIDISVLGFEKVLINSIFLIAVFLVFSLLFVWFSKYKVK